MTEPGSGSLVTAEEREFIDAFLDAHLDELIAFRRRVHAHPELSNAEYATTEAIVTRFQIAELAPQVLPSGTGVVCDVYSAAALDAGIANPPTIALRADIDALAMQDESTTPYRSTVPGVAHACGHDVHTTVVLGAGLLLRRLLQQDESLIGRVRLLFEPGEESLPGGAIEIIEQGHLENVGAIYGMHCDPKVDVGMLGITDGPITSAADLVDIELFGPGGHTARPELTVDLVTVMAMTAIEVPRRVREMANGEPLKLTFGSVKAGDAPNVIPTYARLFGTIRVQDHQLWLDAPKLIDAALAEIVGPTGATWNVKHHRGVPPVVNESMATEFLRQVAVSEFGEDHIIKAGQSWGGDTFAWYLEKVPGNYCRLGVHNPDSDRPRLDLHVSTFDVDERAIGVGIRTLVSTVLSWLHAQQA